MSSAVSAALPQTIFTSDKTISLTSWEKATNLFLSIITIGGWLIYVEHQYEKSLKAQNWSEAERALKNGAFVFDPSALCLELLGEHKDAAASFLLHQEGRPCWGDFINDIHTLQNEEDEEYEVYQKAVDLFLRVYPQEATSYSYSTGWVMNAALMRGDFVTADRVFQKNPNCQKNLYNRQTLDFWLKHELNNQQDLDRLLFQSVANGDLESARLLLTNKAAVSADTLNEALSDRAMLELLLKSANSTDILSSFRVALYRSDPQILELFRAYVGPDQQKIIDGKQSEARFLHYTHTPPDPKPTPPPPPPSSPEELAMSRYTCPPRNYTKCPAEELFCTKVYRKFQTLHHLDYLLNHYGKRSEQSQNERKRALYIDIRDNPTKVCQEMDAIPLVDLMPNICNGVWGAALLGSCGIPSALFLEGVGIILHAPALFLPVLYIALAAPVAFGLLALCLGLLGSFIIAILEKQNQVDTINEMHQQLAKQPS